MAGPQAPAGATAVGPALVSWWDVSPGADPAPLEFGELSRADRVRAAGYRPQRLREFLAGRALVGGLLHELFPDAAGWSVRNGACRRCGEGHGPLVVDGVPALAGVSSTAGLVVAAAARADQVDRLGIDAEADCADPTRRHDLERLLGPGSEPVLRRWTRIEAVLKADGRGLSVDPAEVRLDPAGGAIVGDPRRYRLAEVAGPPAYLISLAWCAAGAGAGAAGTTTR